MKRVLIIGSGGAGKTTLARRLAAQSGLPLIHLDLVYWRPGWQPAPADQWTETVRGLAAREEWIMDGNYGRTLDLRLQACDTVIFIDFPRLLCLWRVLRRQLRYLGRSRPELPAGCPERLTWEFLWWIWRYPATRREGILARLTALGPEKQVIILRSSLELERFLGSVRPTV